MAEISRRSFVALGAGLFAAALLPRGARRGLVRRELPVMGTIADISVVAPDEHEAQAAIDAAFEELLRVERTMSRFLAASDVGRVNAARGDAVHVAPETSFVLAEAIGWAEATGGAFDPCLGRAVELWDVGRRTEPPPPAAARRLAGRRLYRTLDLATWRGAPAARLGDPDAALDLGGIAKGYAVDRAAAALRARGIRDALVNVGGDLVALGRSEDGDPWRIGVRAPDDPRRLSATLLLSDEAVATSGDYEQFFEHAGRRYHHLLDPGTGAPRVTGRHSLTVVAPTCLAADAAATALFGMDGDAAAVVLARRAPGARIRA
jgi:thiamine biosynthesis lipoprotein